ncbi:hypothetical protein QYE76_065797 [Lolium multiflorum]|uniref:Tf2-1-like SH3-like domain-containing protein n=1 Tax=Lolium multiflorum TaxID=4521 RepID=A0AAD8S9F8_LOLMU|nr:hypothetical protein QYE76_065797 [Lolium multiflorum]
MKHVELVGVGRGNRGRGFVELGARRVPPQQQDDGLGKPKFSIPKFEGGDDVEEYLTWELKIEKLWPLHEYTEDKKGAPIYGANIVIALRTFPTSSSKPVSNVSNTKKPEPAASTSGSSMSTARNRDMNFHTYGGKGHFKRDCPNRKVMIINEDNEYETGDDVDPYAPEDDDYDSDGVDAYPSEARTIVVSQRALNVLPSASTQRCNLFQTKALVGPDKACKVIIDGGSCRNLASKELCTKLKLKYLPHPHPYYIQWLSDNGEMKVNHMVRVEFEIGPYKDSIDFDVVPMTSQYGGIKEGRFCAKIHVKTKELIEKKGKSNAARMNKKRKEMLFKPGDMVWVHFRKDRFPKLRKSKLLPRGAGPYKVLAKINDNAYSIDLPIDEFGVSNSFNVADLTPYDGEDLGASRSMKYEEGASIARGEEEQLDKKLDMELAKKLDMKKTHGSAREEREACARGEAEVQAGARPGLTGRHAGASGPWPGPIGRHADQPGADRIPHWCQPGNHPGALEPSPGHHPVPDPVETGWPGPRPGRPAV